MVSKIFLGTNGLRAGFDAMTVTNRQRIVFRVGLWTPRVPPSSQSKAGRDNRLDNVLLRITCRILILKRGKQAILKSTSRHRMDMNLIWQVRLRKRMFRRRLCRPRKRLITSSARLRFSKSPNLREARLHGAYSPTALVSRDRKRQA